MCRAYEASRRAGICREDLSGILYPLLEKNGLPTRTSLPYAKLIRAMRHDKKRAKKTLSLVLPVRLGECTVYDLPVDQLEDFFA